MHMNLSECLGAAMAAQPRYLNNRDNCLLDIQSDGHLLADTHFGAFCQKTLVVDPIIGTKRLTKVLMDGGSGLNIMYAKTLDAMGIDRSRIRPTGAPFYGIMPRKQAMPLGQIDLPVTFGDPTNYRMETLTFEVVGFHRTYHAILGHPCYAKFMAVPNYIYLKLKMPGLCRVITIGTSFQRAYK